MNITFTPSGTREIHHIPITKAGGSEIFDQNAEEHSEEATTRLQELPPSDKPAIPSFNVGHPGYLTVAEAQGRESKPLYQFGRSIIVHPSKEGLRCSSLSVGVDSQEAVKVVRERRYGDHQASWQWYEMGGHQQAAPRSKRDQLSPPLPELP